MDSVLSMAVEVPFALFIVYPHRQCSYQYHLHLANYSCSDQCHPRYLYCRSYTRMGIYSHVLPNMQQEAVMKLNDIIGVQKDGDEDDDQEGGVPVPV